MDAERQSELDRDREELALIVRGMQRIVRRGRRMGRSLRAPTDVESAPSLPAGLPPGAEVPAGPALTREDVALQARAATDLESLAREVAKCRACTLCETRTQTVFMDGQGTRKILFVGEAPGADEDRTGVPFVGRAGQLLTDIITKGMGLARSEVHIANVIKCRPPENREPTAEEKETCTPWLERQIELVDPALIIPLGKHAATYLLGMRPQTSMNSIRGRVHERRGRKLVPTFHPAYLLRSPGEKKECWKDIQVAMAELGIKPPGGAKPGSP